VTAMRKTAAATAKTVAVTAKTKTAPSDNKDSSNQQLIAGHQPKAKVVVPGFCVFVWCALSMQFSIPVWQLLVWIISAVWQYHCCVV